MPVQKALLLLFSIHVGFAFVDPESMSCSLLQVTDVEQPGLNATLTPVGRTFQTRSLKETTSFFRNVFKARETPANITYNPSCMSVATMEWAYGISLTFVEYHDSDVVEYIDAVEEQWNGVGAGSYDYTRWLDNHDGFNIELEDHMDTQFYLNSSFYIERGGVFTRFIVPGTLWSIELSGSLVQEANLRVNTDRGVGVPSSDDWCRVPTGDVTDETPFSLDFWWKSTFASHNPTVASNFVVQNLFAKNLTSEYPGGEYPGGEDCTFSEWVELPGTTYELHFARTQPCANPRPTTDDWVKHQEDIRRIEEGKFDQYMSNNLILWANSLDSFVEQFTKNRVPFFVVQLSDHMFALYLNIPENMIVIQLRSEYLTFVAPLGEYNTCG